MVIGPADDERQAVGHPARPDRDREGDRRRRDHRRADADVVSEERVPLRPQRVARDRAGRAATCSTRWPTTSSPSGCSTDAGNTDHNVFLRWVEAGGEAIHARVGSPDEREALADVPRGARGGGRDPHPDRAAGRGHRRASRRPDRSSSKGRPARGRRTRSRGRSSPARTRPRVAGRTFHVLVTAMTHTAVEVVLRSIADKLEQLDADPATAHDRSRRSTASPLQGAVGARRRFPTACDGDRRDDLLDVPRARPRRGRGRAVRSPSAAAGRRASRSTGAGSTSTCSSSTRRRSSASRQRYSAGAALKRGRTGDRRRRPPADAADPGARLDARAAPRRPGRADLRVDVRVAPRPRASRSSASTGRSGSTRCTAGFLEQHVYARRRGRLPLAPRPTCSPPCDGRGRSCRRGACSPSIRSS